MVEDVGKTTDTFTLHTFFASSCGQRILIAASLKGIPLIYKPVNMATKEHKTAEFIALNPSGGIPVLEVTKADGAKFVLSQTLAIFEYLEERFPEPRLLPAPDAVEQRACVRQLVGVMVSDTFPLSNSRIAGRVKQVRGELQDAKDFVTTVNHEGFQAYEQLITGYGGRFSFGDEVTWADVCLVAQMDLVLRNYDFKFEKYPKVWEVYNRCMEIEAFQKAYWKRQVDTPEQYRE
jgi:maleylacetoacetate isomerase